MKKYGLGIIGFGGMGYYHYQKIAKDDRMFIAGIYDINDERMKFAAEQDINTYESAEALLADEKVNIVLVATPNNFHKDYCVRALDSGKNVVCEKPVCMDMQELDEIERAVERSGKFFTVHFNRRWDVDFNIIKNVLAENLVG
ncbi:MAG: Gfo/Idh/MocA family oxidoreductase, partial [Clostridia bacterium]|nr:Gfo/Idh/MocA family oxidoreductase [Clostridia bacterium]